MRLRKKKSHGVNSRDNWVRTSELRIVRVYTESP